MSYVRVWVHYVFTTKYKTPWLTKEIRYKVCQHIIQNCKEKGIFLQAVNGYTDHLHCLVALGRDQSISKVAQLIKGESSFWINKNNLIPEKFSWQDDYWAVSASESHAERLVNYIRNQEEHHSKKTFQSELDDFLAKYGWKEKT